jgi:hypothetical protein
MIKAGQENGYSSFSHFYRDFFLDVWHNGVEKDKTILPSCVDKATGRKHSKSWKQRREGFL